ncbi:3-methyladenine DNA glycosylase AlkD [Ensifer sp. WSM1721]
MTLSPTSTAQEIIDRLRLLGSEENIAGMARFGIATEAALGLSNVELRRISRQVKTDHARGSSSGARASEKRASWLPSPPIPRL